MAKLTPTIFECGYATNVLIAVNNEIELKLKLVAQLAESFLACA